MARTRTLTLLRGDIRWRADMLGATLRHDDTNLTREINQSIQRYREWISDNGFAYFLTSHSGTLSVGATSPYAFGTIDISAVSPNVVRIYGLDITVDSEDIRSLKAVDFAERNELQGKGTPEKFSMYSSTKIAIFPPSDTAYAFVLWYLPVQADLSIDGDTFDGFVGWEDWITWDCVIKLIVRDERPQAFQLALGEREKCQQDILRRSRHLQRVNPMGKRDTRAADRLKKKLIS